MTRNISFISSDNLMALKDAAMSASPAWTVVVDCSGLYSHNCRIDTDAMEVRMVDVTSDERASGDWTVFEEMTDTSVQDLLQ